MRESIEAEIPDTCANPLADAPAAIRSALTCAPTSAADALRETGAGRRGRTRVTETGRRKGRAVGSGEAICRRTIVFRVNGTYGKGHNGIFRYDT
ncbi:hypothetical protein GmRootV213_30540 [Variovorax sp. V213]